MDAMAVSVEKATTAVEKTDMAEPSIMNGSDVKHDGDIESASLEKPMPGMTEDQYPHGMKLVLLAVASLVAVFLIALDQVSKPLYSCS